MQLWRTPQLTRMAHGTRCLSVLHTSSYVWYTFEVRALRGLGEWGNKSTAAQTWSFRDLGLGLETSRDPFLQVLVSVLVVNLGVLVLVLVFKPSSLSVSVLVLVLGWRLEVAHSDMFKVLHPLLEKVFFPPATSATVVRIFSHSGLLMRANRARMGDNMLSQLVYLRRNSKLLVFMLLHSCD